MCAVGPIFTRVPRNRQMGDWRTFLLSALGGTCNLLTFEPTRIFLYALSLTMRYDDCKRCFDYKKEQQRERPIIPAVRNQRSG